MTAVWSGHPTNVWGMRLFAAQDGKGGEEGGTYHGQEWSSAHSKTHSFSCLSSSQTLTAGIVKKGGRGGGGEGGRGGGGGGGGGISHIHDHFLLLSSVTARPILGTSARVPPQPKMHSS